MQFITEQTIFIECKVRFIRKLCQRLCFGTEQHCLRKSVCVCAFVRCALFVHAFARLWNCLCKVWHSEERIITEWDRTGLQMPAKQSQTCSACSECLSLSAGRCTPHTSQKMMYNITYLAIFHAGKGYLSVTSPRPMFPSICTTWTETKWLENYHLLLEKWFCIWCKKQCTAKVKHALTAKNNVADQTQFSFLCNRFLHCNAITWKWSLLLFFSRRIAIVGLYLTTLECSFVFQSAWICKNSTKKAILQGCYEGNKQISGTLENWRPK